jgi:hypothetical protein
VVICYKHFHNAGLTVTNADASWGDVTTTYNYLGFGSPWTTIEGPMMITEAMPGQTIELTLTVTMSDNSQQTFTATIDIPLDALVTAPTVDVTEMDCNGIAMATLEGESILNFWWSNGSALNPATYTQTGPAFVVVTYTCAGTIQFDMIEFDIEEFTPITATATTTDVLACGTGGVFGSVSLTIEGGQGPYTVFWSPITGDGFEGADNSMFVVTDAGTIGFVIQDVNECESDPDVVLVDSDELSATMTLIPTDLIVGTTAGGATNILCYGTIEVEFDGPEGFEFELSPYPGVDFDPATNSFHPLIAAPFTVIATAGGALGNGCVITEEVSLELVPWEFDAFDFDGNGFINFTDLQAFLSFYGVTCNPDPCAYGDFNDDGVVSMNDLNAFLAVLNQSFPGCP